MVEKLKVMIGVPDAGYSRNTTFGDYLAILQQPENTLTTRTHGQSPAKARNLMIQQALDNDCSHLLFIDDDVAFKPDSLMKLLAHDVDVASGLFLMRNYPHQPIAFDEANADGSCIHYFLENGTRGLTEVVAVGFGFCLIKIEVFKKMKGPHWVTLGELEPDGWCDDISFFRRVRQAGFKIHLDLSCPIGHMAQVTIWPNYVDGKWLTSYDTSGSGIISVPAIQMDDMVPQRKQEFISNFLKDEKESFSFAGKA